MAYTFTTSTDFTLVSFDPITVDGGEQPPGEAKVQSGYHYERDEYTCIIERFGCGLSSAAGNRVGDELDGASISFKNGADTVTLVTGATYKCIENPIHPMETGLGCWREVQAWKWTSAWTEVENE